MSLHEGWVIWPINLSWKCPACSRQQKSTSDNITHYEVFVVTHLIFQLVPEQQPDQWVPDNGQLLPQNLQQALQGRRTEEFKVPESMWNRQNISKLTRICVNDIQVCGENVVGCLNVEDCSTGLFCNTGLSQPRCLLQKTRSQYI